MSIIITSFLRRRTDHVDGTLIWCGQDKLTFKAQRAKKYKPNGERECARRIRQDTARGGNVTLADKLAKDYFVDKYAAERGPALEEYAPIDEAAEAKRQAKLARNRIRDKARRDALKAERR